MVDMFGSVVGFVVVAVAGCCLMKCRPGMDAEWRWTGPEPRGVTSKAKWTMESDHRFHPRHELSVPVNLLTRVACKNEFLHLSVLNRLKCFPRIAKYLVENHLQLKFVNQLPVMLIMHKCETLHVGVCIVSASVNVTQFQTVTLQHATTAHFYGNQSVRCNQTTVLYPS